MQTRRRNRSAAHALIAAVIPAATAFIGVAANAAPSIQIINLGTANGATVGTRTGWTAFTIVATADSGDTISHFDFATGSRGIFGSLLQRWIYYGPDFPTPLDSTQTNSSSATSLDTHLVVYATETSNKSSVSEDNAEEIGSLPPDFQGRYGTGTFLKGIFDITSGAQSSRTLAYIVLKDGTTGTAIFDVTENTGSGTIDTPYNMTFAVPEPASAAVTGLSASLLLLSRRKRSG
jgi:hypothetical protein